MQLNAGLVIEGENSVKKDKKIELKAIRYDENGNVVEPVVSEDVSVGSLEAAEERIETVTNFDKIETTEPVETAPEIQR